MELMIFFAFVAIQYAAKSLPSWLEHNSKARVFATKLSNNHFVVWVAHPAILQGLHEYVIHFIIYSGYVIRAH